MNATTYRVPRKKVLKTTVRLIKEIAWTNRNKPEIKYAAVKILEDSGIQNGRDRRRVAVALSDFIKNEIKYFYDPHRGETIQTPQITLAVRYGDCDDMAVLLAALLMSCGIEARFHVKGYNRPQHIYVEALTQDGWIGLDPARTAGDPHPSQLKTFMLSGYREVKKKMRGIGNYETGGIGQVPRMNNKLRAKRIKGEIRTRRPLTPVTKAGTLIEQAANAPVIVRVSRPRKPGQTPDVRVSVLPHISPHRIEKYEVDRNRGLLYPVLKKEPELKDSPTYLDMGITETDTLNRALASPDIIKDLGLSGVEEFNELGELGGWAWVSGALRGVKGAARKVKKFVKTKITKGRLRPRARLRQWRSARTMKKAQKSYWDEMERKPKAEKIFDTAGFSDLLQVAVGKGDIPRDVQDMINEYMEQGAYDEALRTAQTAAPEYFGEPPPETPGWVIPAGVGLIAWFFLFRKKGRK